MGLSLLVALYATTAWSSSVIAPNVSDKLNATLAVIQENSLIGYSSPLSGLEAGPVLAIYRDYQIEALNLSDNMEWIIAELIDCESKGDNAKIGDHGLSYGILQFRKDTFYRHCAGDWLNPNEQIKCAEIMIKKGLGPKVEGWYNCWRIKNLPL